MENNNKRDIIFCSFCGINNEEAKNIIIGPNVYICNECVEMCCELLEETGIKKRYCYNKDTEEFVSAYINKEVEESEIDKYRNLVIRKPRDADLLFQLGKRYLLRRYYPEANECFKAADKICNDSDEIKFYLGLSYSSLGFVQQATKSFIKSSQINPENAEPLLALGRLYFELRLNLNLSVYYSQKCLEIKNDCASAYYNAGKCHYCMKNKELAIENFKNALHYDSERSFPHLFRFLTGMLCKKKRFDEASEILHSELIKYPDDAEIYNSLGTVSYKTGRKSEAFEFYKKAHFKEPDRYCYTYDYAKTALEIGQRDDDALKAVKIMESHEDKVLLKKN